MITPTALLGWLAIGVAASLAAMVLPFRRGTVGVAWNALLGLGGAILGALLSYLVTTRATADAPERLAFATAGAVVLLAVAHVAWVARYEAAGARRHP